MIVQEGDLRRYLRTQRLAPREGVGKYEDMNRLVKAMLQHGDPWRRPRGGLQMGINRQGNPPVPKEKGSRRPPLPPDKGILPFSKRRTMVVFVPCRTRRRSDTSLGGRLSQLGNLPD